ncbi:MAG: hypothetical protein GY862_09210 [Gammaproteobacteria bacterium]|nr:hypothetical protein [Gammaproteobacteria bacterium]
MNFYKTALAAAVVFACTPAFGSEDLDSLRQQLQELKQSYQQQIDALEKRLQAAEKAAEQAQIGAQRAERKATQASQAAPAGNFNPDISVILEGRYADFQNDPEDYALPGFQTGGEAGLGEEGLSLGHSEMIVSANVDDKFYAQLTAALHAHEGTTEVELEEAFIQTLGLGHGLTVKAGRFFSDIGYLNNQHPHAWDFADAPLIYRGLFGEQLYDDGLQVSWLAPTDLYVNLGAELLRGESFPAGGGDGSNAYSLFAKIGGDIGVSHSWQFGLSHWAAEAENRAGGHDHAHEEESGEHEHDMEEEHDEHEAEWLLAEPLGFTGDTRISGIDFVWKWAPNGNPKNSNFKLQAEYFRRSEDGELHAKGTDELLNSAYDGRQRGFYVQSVYQFMPQWRIGLRYDRLFSDNRSAQETALDPLGLHSDGYNPQRYSLMLDWSNSEYSRVRLQFNRDESMPDVENQLFLQYIHSIGAHGAHSF